MPAPINRCSPLIRTGASSRAQRMLVLGLQKAAEQNARQKRSEPPSEPTTPESKNSPTAISPSVGQSLITDSPSGKNVSFFCCSGEDYLPITYTELDLSQQSSGCDSQSQSQSRLSGPSWDQFRSCVPHASTLDSAVDVDVSSDVHTADSEAVTEITRPVESDVVDLSALPQKTAQPVVEAIGLRIMRNFSSRKKVQRVSFAERPVVYTFGFSESPPSVPDLPTPLKSDEPVQLVLSTSDSTLFTQTSDSVSTDLETVNVNSDEIAVDTRESASSSSVVAPYCPPIDLDDSHSSFPSDSCFPPHEWESPLLPTVPHGGSDPIAFTHRSRKSTSPQRRLLVSKAVVTSPSTVLTSLVKPVSNATSVVRLPERRRLFVSKSFEENDAIEVVSETEPDEIGIDLTRSATVIALDSEPVEITDTQPSQDNTTPDPTFKASALPSTQEDSECMLIESSQGTQETSELQPAHLSSDVRVESSQLDDAPVFALHKSVCPFQ
ncbi:hypothetical protein AHF37_05526 [Paragonimus kellicotti]|nr:hypothetical protein AHF37_05526 [Paragonimus kellicotti]